MTPRTLPSQVVNIDGGVMTSDTEAQQQAAEAEDRARTLYWRELVQMKHEARYVRRYRDSLATRLTWFDVGRAVISVGALGSWIAGLGIPKLWGCIIVISQVGEAVMAKLPLTARLKGLAGLCNALDPMLIDALLEWENIQADQAGGASGIVRRWHALMKVRHEAEQTNLPDGLPLRKRLFRLAEQDTTAYFEACHQTRRLP